MHTYKTDPEKLYLLEVVTTETFEGWNGQKKTWLIYQILGVKFTQKKKLEPEVIILVK